MRKLPYTSDARPNPSPSSPTPSHDGVASSSQRTAAMVATGTTSAIVCWCAVQVKGFVTSLTTTSPHSATVTMVGVPSRDSSQASSSTARPSRRG